jgi:ABC-type enterochelin transport system substrate-binding protein
VLGSILAITSGVVLVVNSAEDAVKWGIETIVVAGVQTVLEAVNKFSEEKYKSIEKKIGEE